MTGWPAAVEALLRAADTSPGDLAATWTLVYAAERATLRLAAEPSAEDEVRWTEAAAELSAALAELEHTDPGLPGVAAAVDLGRPLLDSGANPSEVVARLVRAAIADLRVGPKWPAREALLLARVSGLLSGAHVRLTGRLP